MNGKRDQAFDAWVRAQQGAEASPGFEDRVMAAIDETPTVAAEPDDLWSLPWFRVAAWAAASLVFALRLMAPAIAVWLT